MLLILVAVAACGGKRPAAAPTVERDHGDGSRAVVVDAARADKPVTQQSLASVGLDPEALDRTIDPCEDFYQFACGGWIKKTEIPADKPIAMRGFIEIQDRNLAYEHELLEGLRADPGEDPAARQLGAFYGSCMDEAAVEKAGLAALRPQLAVIDSVKDVRSLTAAIGALQASGVDVLFTLRPVQDAANARQVIAEIDQGGLGLPDRDYYMKDDEQARGVRSAYVAYIEGMLAAIGRRAAHREAAEIVALETELARLSKDKVARRDPRGTYHKLERAAVARLMPRFDWEAFWSAVGLKDVHEITVTSPERLAGIDALLASVRPATWRAYLAFHATSAAAPMLTKLLEETQFAFASSLTGQPELPPRWKRCTQRTERALGDLIGQRFVRDQLDPASKLAAEEHIHAIVTAMSANLDTLPWMDDATRERAKLKLIAMTYQIGQPNQWKTYGFKIDPRAWSANALAARKAERARQLAKIGRLVDKDDWQLAVPQATAAYERQLNRMVFPAGVLQPPFYSATASIPVNLGGLGVLVGHELTHGFDDRGAQFDADGNLVDWWQPDTAQLFKQRTQCVIDQYSSYEVAGGTKLDGARAVGENIADIGGVKLALAAFRQLRAAALDSVVADGFTEDQQFFLGFGQAMCAKLRPETEKLLTAIDDHAPPKWRVNGALSATPDFARTFRCKAGSKMVPVQQCVVW
ncbi:MAG: M13 family metallopeptidase [Myxococcales bacterium]|nr:M13 family metallopeptidase [Myxococcales bacterium]